VILTFSNWEAKVSRLAPSQKEVLLWKVLADLKEARERLKANSQTVPI
jgi:hypothetical protein